MKRLEELQKELNIVQDLPCLAFNLKEKCIEYYKHEIDCIVNWNSPNPDIGGGYEQK